MTGIEEIDGGEGYNTLYLRYSSDRILDVSNIALTNIDELSGTGDHTTIIGTSGADRINGGMGNDTLSGGDGDDIYHFSQGDGRDIINNSDTDTTINDLVVFDDIAYDDLWLSRSGDHLLIDVIGAGDQVKINNWYSDISNQLGLIQASDLSLLHADVDQLVNAMAVFNVSDGVGAVVPEDVRQQLESTLTAVWQASV